MIAKSSGQKKRGVLLSWSVGQFEAWGLGLGI